MKQHQVLKRILACVMVVIMTLTAVPLSVFAATTKKIIKSGSCGEKGDNVKYTLYDDGTLIISGRGKMEDYEFSQAEGIIVPYADNSYSEKYGDVDKTVKNVVIENGITRIGNEAFAYFINLKSVSIPDSVTSIGKRAFAHCIGLKNIMIPDSVISIGENAFWWCTGLTRVTIPNSVKRMDYAFKDCANLTSVTIESGVTSIGDGTFEECAGLTSITIPDSVTSIGEWAFFRCTGLKNVIIDNGVISIGNYAFKECTGLKSIIIPDSVKCIDEWAFYGCTDLTSLTIGNSVTSIGNLAFGYCSGLTSVSIPKSITSLGCETFFCCTGLISVAIGSGLTSIGEEFALCTGLKRIAIPDTVKSIDEYAFNKCEKLRDVYYYGSKEQWKNVQGVDDNYVLSEANIHYNHTHTNKTTTTKATTTRDGQIVTACTVCGAVSKTKTIYKASSVKLSKTAYTYNGKVQKPSVTVKNSKGKALKNGTDYTVSYASGCKNTGKYAVKITFKGNYSGTKTLYFNILPSKTSKLSVSQTTSSIKATWKTVTGATGYKVTLYNSKGKAVKTVDTTKTTYTFSKLSKGTTYKVRVTAYKTIDGKKVSSSVYTQLTTATKPGTPTLKVKAGAKKASLSWNKQTGASGYVVYMATSKNGTYKKIATVKGGTKTSYTKTGLTKGKTYYFKVKAYKTVDGKNIYGAYSTVKYAKIK